MRDEAKHPSIDVDGSSQCTVDGRTDKNVTVRGSPCVLNKDAYNSGSINKIFFDTIYVLFGKTKQIIIQNSIDNNVPMFSIIIMLYWRM